MAKKENLYKTLGTTAKIGDNRIKEKYIKAVKKHSPETDPEGFEKVRHAYEVLKDPESRKQYDLTRKYGSLDKLVEEARYEVNFGSLEKAHRLLNKAETMNPNDLDILMGKMKLAEYKNDIDSLDVYFYKILKLTPASESEEISSLHLMRISSLIENEWYEKALKALAEWETRTDQPSDLRQITGVYATVYMALEQTEKAWQAIQKAIPSVEDEVVFEDILILFTCCNMMFDLEKLGEKSKVQDAFRRFLKKLEDVEDREEAFDMLGERAEEFLELVEYRIVLFYIDLQLVLYRTDALEKKQKEIKKLAKIQGEIEKIQADEKVFPLIIVDSLRLFYKGTAVQQSVEEEILEQIPKNALQDFEAYTEDYAAGILRIKRKYAVLYKHFKTEWDEKFAALTAGFSREMRRELKRMS